MKKKGYDFGKINWDEFWQVVGGNSPCNKERVDARRKAKEDGKWVVEAAMAFATKEVRKNQRKMTKNNQDWPLWEVFIRSKQGLNHKHVGSLEQLIHLWQLKMQEMFTQNEWKESQYG